jgi:hypothetical protein
MYAMFLELSGPNAIGGDRPVAKGPLQGGHTGLVADVRI